MYLPEQELGLRGTGRGFMEPGHLWTETGPPGRRAWVQGVSGAWVSGLGLSRRGTGRGFVVCAVWVSPECGFLWSVVCRLCELQLWWLGWSWLWVSLEDSAYDFEAEGTHLELRAVGGSTRDSEINEGFEN
jgi:hypothetical protein